MLVLLKIIAYSKYSIELYLSSGTYVSGLYSEGTRTSIAYFYREFL